MTTTTPAVYDHAARSAAVLDYWFGANREQPEERYQLWYSGTDEIDAAIRAQFSTDVEAARAGTLDRWMEDKHSALALILLMDQFPLNIYRDTPLSFDTSAQAIPYTYQAIAKGYDVAIPGPMRSFIYMPLEHSENIVDQEKCVELFDLMGGSEYAVEHRDIVKKYGRFPGRNVVHGRVSNELELEYLKNGGVF
jgi:uncharacterized protein (DUF924 family)